MKSCKLLTVLIKIDERDIHGDNPDATGCVILHDRLVILTNAHDHGYGSSNSSDIIIILISCINYARAYKLRARQH